MARCWRTHRGKGAWRTVGLLAVAALVGCEDIDWDWELQEWSRSQRPIRPSRRRAPDDLGTARSRVRTTPPPTEPTTPQAGASTGDAPGGDREAATAAAPAAPVSRSGRAYHHLYLISESASLKAPPKSKKVRLERARSRSAVDVLHAVYPSIGPSGGEGQRFLVYQHEGMWSAAGEFAPLLDCPERAQAPPAAPSNPLEAFQAGVGLYYRLKQPGQATDFKGFRECVRLMIRAARADNASGQLRWGAALLAGQVAEETLSEFAEARQYFELSKRLALPGSVEEMISVYSVADTYVHEGRRADAVRLARSIVQQFAPHSASVVYERASALSKSE